MVDKTDKASVEAETCEKMDKWLKAIRELAKSTSCEKEVSSNLSVLEKTCSDDIKIDFVGAPSSGRSSIINGLLERKILPVTARASGMDFEIQFASIDQRESFFYCGISKPLAEMQETIAFLETKKEHGDFVITVHSDWLSKKRFTLREAFPLDYSDDVLEEKIDEYLRNTDMTILVVDAFAPLRRIETAFLKECITREVPVIVALSKTDRMPEEDRNDVISYVKQNVESYSSDIPILIIQANSGPEVCGIDKLKTAIENLAEKVDFVQIRNHRIAQTLLRNMEIIQINAQVAIDTRKRTEEEKKSEIRKFEQEIDSKNVVWNQIEQSLMERRQKIEEQMRNNFEDNSDAILGKLLQELENSNDIKIWWNRDMPSHLQRELQDSALQLSSYINRQVVSDLKWVQEEITQKFNYNFEIFIEPQITTAGNRPDQKDLSLSDNSRFGIVTKFGTIATVVIAGTIFLTSGFSSIVLATGAISGIIAEQLIRSNNKKDKEKIRSELKIILAQAIKDYMTTFSQNLRTEYGKISSNLKIYNQRWQQAQLEALKAHQDQPENEVDYDNVLQKINTISAEISLGYGLKM